jgi:hypothetical protein
MKLVFFEDRVPLQEIIYGLPSKKLMHTPSVVLVKHPIRDELIVLKSRFSDNETRNLDINTFEVFNVEKRGWNDEYLDLHRKNIIIDGTTLSERSRVALMKL